jgi:phage terminase large subunit-like protein
MEIEAEDIDEAPGALWTREVIEGNRVTIAPYMDRIVVALDPSATSEGDEAGIIAIGKRKDKYYIMHDHSLQGSPLTWAKKALWLYHTLEADCIVAERNNGGEMVSTVINQVDNTVPVKLVHASRGKQTRAEPIAAQYEQGRVHHVGAFAQLEDEMCLWLPGDPSPNRMDAMVWGITELMGNAGKLFGNFVVKW